MSELGEKRVTNRLGHVGLKHRRTSRNAARPLVTCHTAEHRRRRYGCVLSSCGLPSNQRRYAIVTTLDRLAIARGFLFRNESFSFETLRVAGAAPYDGADLGEVLATARLIREGDLDGWLHSWRATAAPVHELGPNSLNP